MNFDHNTLNRIASEIRAEINSRAGHIKIVAIEFAEIGGGGQPPACTIKTAGGTVKERLKFAQNVIEAMGRHKRQLETRSAAA
ncbi:hypothetical protein [Methylobacterium oryzisoli]|uniref:hypothetical protein n=1 Tax=Methylobacterium oryzisoli TaxID=3385502 RepID=UPI00397B41E4